MNRSTLTKLILAFGLVITITPLFWGQQRSPEEEDAIAALKKRGASVTIVKGKSGQDQQEVRWLTGKAQDADLKHLKALPQLHTLDLGSMPVTDEGLAHLQSLTQLRILYLDGSNITDAGLASCKGMARLELLNLSNTKIGNAGLAHLKDLTQLENLSLFGTRVSDVGLAHVKGMTGLKHLYLRSTSVSDVGLASVSGLKNLESLNLDMTNVTDAGLAKVAGLANLQLLSLGDTSIGDAGLAHLQKLSRLRSLFVDGTHITDAGLVNLKGLTSLRDLDLNRTRVSDAGLIHLRGLTNLGYLEIRDTAVTQQGILELKKSLPRLETNFVAKVALTAWTPEVMGRHVRVPPAIEISPDGKKIAYVGDDHLHLADVNGGSLVKHDWRKLLDVSFAFSTKLLQWSPDGKWLAIASSEGGRQRIGRLRVADGTYEFLVDAQPEIGRFEHLKWSPDGKWLAFTALWAPADSRGTFRIVDEPEPGWRSRLFVIPSTPDTTTKMRERVLSPIEYDVSGADRNISFDWFADSKSIVFNHTPKGKRPVSGETDISVVDLAGGAVRSLVDGRAWSFAPQCSPDGRWIAYVASDDPPTSSGNFTLNIIAPGGGKPRVLADTFDKEFWYQGQFLGWSADSKKLYYKEAYRTTSRVCALPLDGTPEVVSTMNEGIVHSVRLNDKGTMLSFAWETPDRASEAFVSSVSAFTPVQITRVNEALQALPIGKTEVIRWKSRDQLEIEGLLTYPVGYDKNKRYPLVLEIHGGPAAAAHQEFIGMPHPCPVAAFAQRGYAVLRCNVRGSAGYGPKFRNANQGDWGGKDVDDLMTGVDHVIALGVADPDRMGVMGWSYGGYLTASVITRTNRFKAASVGAGVTNLVSYSGTATAPAWARQYLGGGFWDRPDFYRDRSPIFFSKNIKTPTLILHGEKDVNVPIGQSYELYNAMKAHNASVQMIVYPNMYHYPTGDEAVSVMERNLDWFDRHVLSASKLPLSEAAKKVKHIIGHRGACAVAPENTLESYRRAIESGATIMEMDVRSTKDGALISLHDADVKRTTNGKGLARAMTLAEIRKLDAGSWFEPRYKYEKIPTMREVLELAKGKIDVMLDLQSSGETYDEDYVAHIAAEVRKHGEPKRTWLGVRSVEQAKLFRKHLPEAKQIGLIPTPKDIDAFAAAKVDVIRLWPKWLNDTTLIPRIREHKLLLHLNGTLGAEDETRLLLAHEPESMASDDPARLIASLRRIAEQK